MIVELVRQGRRVGITACSHKVIGTLLREVCRAATDASVLLMAVQKASDGDECQHAAVIPAKDNQVVLSALTTGAVKVAARSAWLWAREEMADSVDVLFVDEAGQMSLANVLAVAFSESERVSDFRIELPGTDFNDRLCQQLTNIGGRLRCCELLQSIRVVHRSSATALAAKFLGPARLCVQRTMLLVRERGCHTLLTISLLLLALHR
jgi:hypothetical protein